MHADAREALQRHGFHVFRGGHDADAMRQHASLFGRVLNETKVRLVPHRRTYLTSAGAIPFHTDYPDARFLIWLCESQDETDGATLLIDGRVALQGLSSAHQRLLTRITLPAMIRLGDPARDTPIVDVSQQEPRLFYAPWLEANLRSEGEREALHAFRRALTEQEQHPIEHRLSAGEMLLIDNRRMLHGRRRIGSTSKRFLRRLWIASCAATVPTR